MISISQDMLNSLQTKLTFEVIFINQDNHVEYKFLGYDGDWIKAERNGNVCFLNLNNILIIIEGK